MANRRRRVPLRRGLWAMLLAASLSAGCLSRSRLNARCEWNADPGFRLDLQKAGDRQHLIRDVEIAEELGIRYGDGFRRPYGRDEEHARAASCQARLFQIIAQVHGVSPGRVQEARLSRPVVADLVTLAIFTVLYVGTVRAYIRAAESRFGDAGEGALAAAHTVGAVAIGAVSLLGLNLVWVPVVEIVRTGNMHRSLRAAPLPWPSHTGGLFVGGVILFVLVLAAVRRSARPQQR